MHRFALVAILVTTAHAETLDGRFVPAIRAAAQGYAKWGRVDERPNIAPGLCRAPMPGDYGSTGDVRLTRADDDSPHGKKLYYLYASAKPAYLGLAVKDASLPVGFAIVKQSWTPRSASKAEIDERQRISREHERTRVDYFSSGPTFDGWSEPSPPLPSRYEPLPTSPPATWLLRTGWRKHGSISMYAVPGRDCDEGRCP